MDSHEEDDANDLFWSVQLNQDSEARQFACESTSARMEDELLSAGAASTPRSPSGIIGCVRKLSVPFALKGDIREPSNKSLARLQLSLREVNGNGVLSGVGGDLWHAALLLSAWLMTYPEVVRGLRVLELGSGLGLCGIVAGYLARSVTLTDYMDELLVNLEYNVEMNRVPRVEVMNGGARRQDLSPSTNLTRREDDKEVSHHAPHPGIGGQSQQRHLSKHAPLSTRDDPDPGAAGDTGESDLLPELMPLSQVHLRKLDWTIFSGTGEVCGSKWEHDWWEDEGPDVKCDEKTVVPTGQQGEEASETLKCDVVIGSAIIYSPHHACVADLLQQAFFRFECHAAYIIQLSTRPGFDEFLQRLQSCGLRYRLQRMSSILSLSLLRELSRGSTTNVGGPAFTITDVQGRVGGPGGALSYDAFVLCSIFRSSDMRV